MIDRFREVQKMAENNKILTKKREPALYGGEEAFLTPEDVISRGDAADAIKRAEETFNLCKKLLDTYKNKEPSVRRGERKLALHRGNHS